MYELKTQTMGESAAAVGKEALVGSNRMEILLFTLGSGEIFGINVFKVREVCDTPFVTRTPNTPHGVEGLISLRGNVIPVLCLASILGIDGTKDSTATMMVTEYSKRTLGFLVESVDSIVQVDWERVRTADNTGGGAQGLITALTELPDGKLVSILDVETVLSLTFGDAVIGPITPINDGHELNVFFVDDSGVARRKIAEVLDKLGVRHKHAINGAEAWQRLESMANQAQLIGRKVSDDLDLILVDVEMPEMDGYVLTSKIKADDRFAGVPVAMHSSLSSAANRDMGTQVGVDAYVAKFDAAVLADTLRPLLLRNRRAGGH